MSQAVWTGSQAIVVRSWKSCTLWFVFTALPAAIVVFNKPEMTEQNHFLAWLCALFGSQAFVSELLGIRAGGGVISFPRWPLPQLPLAIWRRSIPLEHISRTDSLDARAARFYLTSAERVDVVFPNNESKWRVLASIGKAKAARQAR
jgi:hypothetical protein